MKRKTCRKLLIGGLSCMAMLGVFYGCGHRSQTPAPVTVVPPPVKSSLSVAVSGIVIDANSGAPVVATVADPVTLVIYGDDANKVIDGNGKLLYDATGKFAGPLKNDSGLFSIYLNPGTPTPDKLSLRLVASAKNYVTSSQEVVISKNDLKTDGTTTQVRVTIKLIKQDAPPPTVAAVSAPVSASTGGTTQAAVTVTTPPVTATTVDNTTQNVGQATITIPAATTIYADAARTVPLQAVKVAVTYNNNSTSDSLTTFPGGFVTSQVTSGSTVPTAGGFVSGGFASVEITDASGNKAKSFDKPIDITLTVPKGTLNPETGVDVKTGDVIPIWSYDTTTGAWSVQKLKDGITVTGTLGAPDADGNFPVAFKTDHLSYFNLDWFYWGNGAGGMCNAPITIKGANGNRIYMEAMLAQRGWSHEWWLDAGSPDPATNTITYAPRYPMTVKAWLNNKSDKNMLKSFSFSTLCGGVTLDLTADVNRVLPLTKYGDVGLDVTEVCSQDASKKTKVPSDAVFAVAANLPVVSVVTDTNGHAVLRGLVANSTYTVKVNHRDGRRSELAYTVKEGQNTMPEFTFPVSCSPVTGTTGSTGGSNF